MNKISALSLIVLGILFSAYFGYTQYKNNKHSEEIIDELSSEVERLYQSVNDTNALVIKREQEKAQDRITIKQLQEQVKDALKNDECANKLIPSNVVDWMRSSKN